MIRVVAALTSPARWPTVRPLLAGEIVGTAGTRVVLIALGLASSIVTSRVLQPDGRGEYFWVVTIAQLLVAITVAWVATAIWSATLVAREAGLPWPRPVLNVGVLTDGVHFAAKAYTATLFGFVVLRSSVFVLKAFTSYKDVGYLSIATQL